VIDWTSDETHLLLNPRMPSEERARMGRLVAAAPPLPAHVLIATSGSSGALKVTALSKRALLVSADAVNAHLNSDAGDVWCCVLPTFHVGGLGIYARAFRSGARVVSAVWDAREFAALCEREGVSLASLVPAQVADLVSAALRAPASLRAIVVGGGALSEELYGAARALGWPLLPSYGMTECCSQVGTATAGSPELVLLPHVDARIEADGMLALRSESLLSGYADESGFSDPKRDGWFVTEDRAALEGRILRVYGRAGDFVKIGGESVDLTRLDAILACIASDAAVAAVPDARLGHVIHLFVVSGDPEAVAGAFAERVLPFERPRAVHRVQNIPRSPLGKLLRSKLIVPRNTDLP
jgi:O-succinylbenzoic acid--CoA ligase